MKNESLQSSNAQMWNLFRAIKNLIKPKFKEINHKDYKYPIVIRKGTTDKRVYRDVILRKEYEFQIEKEPNVIIDAGANIGLATIYFANKYPNAKIVAIEPEETNYEILVKNTEYYPNVIRIKAALFDKVGKLDLLDVGFGEWGFMTETSDNYHQIKLKHKKLDVVEATTITKIMQDCGLMEIDILKMDIEGAEKEVFGNASEWICKVKSIIVELHERKKIGCNRAFYCNSNGFDNEWKKGEDIYLTRGNYIKKNI